MSAPVVAPLTPPTAPAALKPLRSRYVVVVLLPLVAFVVAVLWSFASYWSMGDLAKGWTQGPLGGSVTMTVHPGDWFVYADGADGPVTVTVTTPDRRTVPVDQVTDATTYGQKAGTLVARFSVPVGVVEDWTFSTSVTGTTYDPALFYVTEYDQAGAVLAQQVVAGGLLAVNSLCALAVWVVPIVRYRRHLAA